MPVPEICGLPDQAAKTDAHEFILSRMFGFMMHVIL
jgi:hypothetical protein